MKLKGISPLEQHADKAFLGLIGVILLAALASQFLMQPNQIKVGKAEGLPPEDAMVPVAEEARRLQGKLNSTTPELPQVEVGPIADQFAQRLAAPVAPRNQLVALGEGLNVGNVPTIEAAGDRVFAQVEPPAPSDVVAHAFRATIDPYERVSHPELAALLPPAQPFDKAAVSIQAAFDGSELKTLLQRDPDAEGPLEPLLQSWWRDIDILGVEVERQELASQDSLAPEWTNSTILPPLPGRLDMRKAFETAVRGAGDVPIAIQTLRQNAERVRRPAFYRTISGPEWKPPVEAVEEAEQPLGVVPVDKLGQRRQELARIDAQLEKLRAGPDAGGGGGEGRGGEGRGIGGGRSRGGGGGSPPSRGQPAGDEPTLSARDRQIRNLEARREKVAAEIAQLEQAAQPNQPVSSNPTAASTEKPLLENTSVTLWTHDLTAEAGKTYRYRLRAVLVNPLFGRQASLKPEQQEMAAERSIAGAWSEWTGPVAIDPDEYFFMTSASERDGLDSTRATFELFKFYYGYYRRGSVTLYPGDILAAEMTLPANQTLKIYDLEKLSSTAAATPSAETPTQVATTPPSGRGRPRFGYTEGRDGGEAPPSEPTAPAAPEAPPADGSWTPAPKSVRLALNAILLDVAPAPEGAEQGSFESYLKLADGGIGIRQQALDSRSPALQRLRRSAELGVEAAKPRDAAANPADTAPERAPEPPPPPRSAPPRGGGGGGGG